MLAKQGLPQRLCASSKINHGIPITPISPLLGRGQGYPHAGPLVPKGWGVFVRDFPRAALPASAEASAAVGDKDGALRGQVGDWVWSAILHRCRDGLGGLSPAATCME